MPCIPVVDPSCPKTAGDESHPWGPPLPDIPGQIGGNVLDNVAKALQEAVSWFVSKTTSWWVNTDSPDLEHEPAIGFLQSIFQPVTITVAVLALLVMAAKMVLTRKANPLMEAGSGLAVMVVATAIGAALPNVLLDWGDAWSNWVLQAAAQGDFSTRMTRIVTLPSGVPAGLVLIMCLIALFVGIIQAVLLLLRQGAMIILAGLLPLAAAGMITTATRHWFKKVAGWMLALVFYKPLAAAVYATAFTLIGNGKDVRAVLLGFTMMVVSLIAFPVLLKFFNWTTASHEAGGGGILGALIGGATALGALRAYGPGWAAPNGASASEHASYLDQQFDSSERAKDRRTDPEGNGPSGTGSPRVVPGQNTRGSASGDEEESEGPKGTANPSGSRFTATGGPSGGAGDSPGGGHGRWAPPDGGTGEPVGPVAGQAWDNERRRGRESIRWMANPTGSTESDGGPTGAGDARGSETT